MITHTYTRATMPHLRSRKSGTKPCTRVRQTPSVVTNTNKRPTVTGATRNDYATGDNQHRCSMSTYSQAMSGHNQYPNVLVGPELTCVQRRKKYHSVECVQQKHITPSWRQARWKTEGTGVGNRRHWCKAAGSRVVTTAMPNNTGYRKCLAKKIPIPELHRAMSICPNKYSTKRGPHSLALSLIPCSLAQNNHHL